MRNRKLVRVLRFALFAVLIAVVVGFVAMGLWNWLMPDLFGWKSISYWQAWGLIILSKLFFGGFRGGRGGYWRHRMMERCEQMTPEEREKFRQGFYARWGGAAPPEGKTGA